MPINDKGKLDLCLNISFTTKDIIELQQAIVNDRIYDLEGLIEYLNGKFKCNKIVEFLSKIYEEGVKYTPKFNFKPITEKCIVKNGVFKITNTPFAMENSYFVNNLVVVRLFDDEGNLTNSYEFFDDVEVNTYNLECKLKDDIMDTTKINGIASVSYFTLKE
jgi:hypothetical protein